MFSATSVRFPGDKHILLFILPIYRFISINFVMLELTAKGNPRFSFRKSEYYLFMHKRNDFSGEMLLL